MEILYCRGITTSVDGEIVFLFDAWKNWKLNNQRTLLRIEVGIALLGIYWVWQFYREIVSAFGIRMNLQLLFGYIKIDVGSGCR